MDPTHWLHKAQIQETSVRITEMPKSEMQSNLNGLQWEDEETVEELQVSALVFTSQSWAQMAEGFFYAWYSGSFYSGTRKTSLSPSIRFHLYWSWNICCKKQTTWNLVDVGEVWDRKVAYHLQQSLHIWRGYQGDEANGKTSTRICSWLLS